MNNDNTAPDINPIDLTINSMAIEAAMMKYNAGQMQAEIARLNQRNLLLESELAAGKVLAKTGAVPRRAGK